MTNNEFGICVTIDDRRYDRSESEGNEAIFDCTGGRMRSRSVTNDKQ